MTKLAFIGLGIAGDGGVFGTAAPGTLVIDFSSIRQDATAQLAAAARERGLRLLDAPVSGGEAGAKSAGLSIMVGGDPADFEAARPVFAAGEAGVVLPIGAIVAQLMASARACGDGALDHSALLRGVERLAGKAGTGIDSSER